MSAFNEEEMPRQDGGWASSSQGSVGRAPTPFGVSGTEVRTVQTQSQTVYNFWRKTPRFEPSCGSADGTPGFFAIGRLVHDAGDE